MAQTYAELKATVEDITDTIGTSALADAVLETIIADTMIAAFRELARYSPHLVIETFQVESRTGEATSDTASALVDTTSSQFLSTDVGKVVYNSDDKTWAIVTAYVSTSQLTLSKDIFPDGNEAYEIYNKGCANAKQINIEDVTDYLWIEAVEYPIGKRRNWELNGDILTIGINFTPEDTSESDADKDVHVYFAKRHKVSQLTTLTGAVNLIAGYTAGSTSMVLDALQTSGTIEAGQEFTIASTRGTYRVTAAATITTSAATISFFPGLESTVADGTVVTFKSSTLTEVLEPLVTEWVIAKILIKVGTAYINRTNLGGGNIWQQYVQDGRDKLKEVYQKLEKLAHPRNNELYSES